MAITVFPAIIANMNVGIAVSVPVAATGGADPYGYGVSAGAIPTGLTLDDGGLLSGTPSVAGNFTFTILAQDTLADTGTQAYTVTVGPAYNLLVEDGSIVVNANTYLNLTTAEPYVAKTRGETTWAALTNEVQADYLKLATQYLETHFRWYGNTHSDSQQLQWPRSKNYDDKGRVMTAGTIPDQIKRAEAWLAVEIALDPGLLEDADTIDRAGDVKSWSTDGLDVSFGDTNKASAGSGGGGSTKVADLTFAPLFDTRFPELEIIVRSIGEFFYQDFVTTNRKTIVKPS